MLQELGIAGEVIRQGLISSRFQHWDRVSGELVAEFDYALLREETAFPFAVQCESHKLVAIAEARLSGFSHARVLRGHEVVAVEQDDGKAAMQRIFVDGKLVNAQDFGRLWFTPGPEPATQVNEPFLQIMADKGVLSLDKSLKLVIERARIGYMPLEKYDMDLELGKSFPRAICLKWCVLPFDRMSKSVLVATANPFNKQAAAELQAATPNRLIWYVAPPADLVKALKKVFR